MQLFNFQKEVLKSTKEKNRVAYYLDMGLGKTFVGSEKAISFAETILIICQKSKIKDWIQHFEDQYEIRIKNLTKKDDLEFYLYKGIKMIGVINYELAWRRKELLALRNFTLMLDESSLIQNKKAKQTKFILQLQPTNVVLLSGTPTSGKYENLWTQAKLLGWPISESMFLSHYVNFKNLNVAGMTIRVVDKDNPYKNVERLKQKLREYGATFLKTEEVIDLPEQTFIPITVPRTRLYDKFKKYKVVALGEKFITGDTQLTYRLRLRQLASEYNENKLDYFEDLINSSNDRFIVFYNFTSELAELVKCVKNRPVSIINGETKDLTAYENESDSITFIQYQAGAMGLNLQKANKVIYFSPPERSELFEQSKKRIHRVGQQQPCFYYQLITDNSIDGSIYKALEKREDYTNELFKDYLD